MERKEDKYVLWEYIYKLSTLQRKISSLVSLIAFMIFNDSFGVENYGYWAYESKMRSGESNDLEIMFIRSGKCHLCHLEPSYTSLGLTLPSIGSIQCTPCQFSVLRFILSQVVLQWALNPYWSPIVERPKNINLPLTTTMTFSSFGLIMAYSIFTYFISYLITFIYSVLKLYQITNFMYMI